MSGEFAKAEPSVDTLRLLRCRKTHRYFTGEAWTDDPAQAELFPNSLDAIRTCLSRDIRDVELVLCAPGTHAELFSTQLR